MKIFLSFVGSKLELMAEIPDSGRKGYFMLYLAIAFLLFIALVVYLYTYNGKFLPS